jgi:hypothetical protein
MLWMKYAFSWKKIASKVIGENEIDKNKCISYGSMIGLLLEVIKKNVINLVYNFKNKYLNYYNMK